MKKACFFAMAMVAALALLTCDFGPVGEEPVFSAKGQRLLPIKIGLNSRALTDDIAKTYVNYFEVAFKSGDEYFRIAWRSGDEARIYVPAGDYASYDPTGIGTPAKAAIMFAGRMVGSKRVLLAVGSLTGTDAGPSVTVINNATKSVTFSLRPIETDLDAPGTITVSPAFTPGTPPRAAIEYIGNNPGGITRRYPVVSMDENKQQSITYKITDSTAIPEVVGIILAGQGSYTTEAVLAPNPEIAPGWTIGTNPVPITKGSTDPLNSTTGNGTGSPTTFEDIEITAGEAFTGKFDIKITTPDSFGLSAISFEIPVCALNHTASFPNTWYISGGMRNSEYDTGLMITTCSVCTRDLLALPCVGKCSNCGSDWASTACSVNSSNECTDASATNICASSTLVAPPPIEVMMGGRFMVSTGDSLIGVIVNPDWRP